MKTLHPLYYVAKTEQILPLLVEGIKNSNDKLRFFGNFDGHVFDALDYLMVNHYSPEEGAINLQTTFKVIKEIAATYDMAKYFFYPLFPQTKDVDIVNCQSEDKELFAVGKLDEDFADMDSDPYETAGGYRNWLATKGTTVKYYLNSDLSVKAEFDSNCIVDHYNNNIAGVSTGNGTKNYPIGENVKTRSINLGREFLDKDYRKTDFKATVKKIDVEKLKALILEKQPLFDFLKK